MSRRVGLASFQAKELLRKSNLKAKKGLGQHFLIDENALKVVISTAELSAEDIIVEVGPGLGILTNELARQTSKVIAIELDTKLASLLEHRVASFFNVTVVNADVLKVNLSDLLEGRDGYKVVANLPYYITSPVLQYFVEAKLKPSLMVVMLQKEVGETIVASPGEMTWLSNKLQFYSKPRIISYVLSQSFYPQPKVDSVIVRFDMLPEPAVEVANTAEFFDMVRLGFSAPRKQLRNSLAQGLHVAPSEATPLLERAGIEPQRRAETLALLEWKRLYDVLKVLGKGNVPC